MPKGTQNERGKEHERNAGKYARTQNKKGKEHETEVESCQKKVPGFELFYGRTRIPPDPEFSGSRIPKSRIPTSGSRIVGSRDPEVSDPGIPDGIFSACPDPEF